MSGKRAAASLHYVHSSRAKEGITYFVLADSLFAQCVVEVTVCVYVCVCVLTLAHMVVVSF